MKAILATVCTGALAFAMAAQGASVTNNDEVRVKARTRGASAQTSSSTTVKSGATVNTRRSVNTGGSRVRARTYANTNGNVVTTSPNRVRTVRERNVTTANNVRVRNHANVNRERNVTVNRERNINRDRNVVVRERNVNRNVSVNRNRNVVVTNNWRSDRFSGRNYAAFRDYRRAYHDRGWWHRHYNRIVFVSGGWYYWNDGYWFPAWGYAANAYYPYDGPIYGYNGLGPDRVIVDVQAQLQRDGYYAGPIDGELGPMTRQAIANFQADHGLAITSAIDEPTLDSLGLV